MSKKTKTVPKSGLFLYADVQLAHAQRHRQAMMDGKVAAAAECLDWNVFNHFETEKWYMLWGVWMPSTPFAVC